MLVNAIYLAELFLHAEPMALFQDVPMEHEDLPGVGPIKGSLDYLTSSYLRAIAELGTDESANIRMAKPYLLVVEAKLDASWGTNQAHYRLIAQMLTLDYRHP